VLFIFFESCSALFIKNYGEPDLFMGGLPVLHGRVYPFSRGSAISCRDGSPLYHGSVYRRFIADEQPVDIQFDVHELSYVFKAGNTGLHPFNMSVSGGQLVAIMGGSGAGKSTLLNVLNGSSAPAGGSVLINGRDVYRHKSELHGLIGYVSQDDLLLEDLTVWQNLHINAQLCFGQLGPAMISEKVEFTLRNLGLWEAAHLKVGSPLEKFISGGQRKRLNIALELIREPPVLFVDEPTSGLSSRDSQMLMDLLKDMANKGKLIFVVIHQPGAEIFRLFDHLLLLDQGGYVVYQGKPLESLSYLKKLVGLPGVENHMRTSDNARPEQLFTILEAESVDEYGAPTGVRRRSPQDWYSAYRNTEKTPDADPPVATLPPPSLDIPPAWKQTKIFMWRDVLSKVSNFQYVFVNLLEAPALALIVGIFLKHATHDNIYSYFYNDNVVVYLFISVVVALFLGLSLSAEEIIKDRKIRKRESFLHLNSLGYLVSKVLVLLVIAAAQTALFAWVGNTIIEVSGNFLTHWFILFSGAAVSVILGLNLSASFKDVVTVYILIPFILIPQILFSGVLVKYDALHPWFATQGKVPWIGNLMPSRWFFEALVVDRGINNQYDLKFKSVLADQYRWDYYRNYWTPEMEQILQKAYNPEDPQQIRAAKTLLNEFQSVHHRLLSPDEKAVFPKKIVVNLNTEKDFLRKVLLAINNRSRGLLNEAINRRDSLTGALRKHLGEEGFENLRSTYSNKEVTDFLNNTNTVERIVWAGNTLVRKINYPYFPGRHYYTSSRNIGGKSLTVVSYNLWVMWITAFILLIALHFQILPKLINRRKMF
jgi:ABC-type multidrug transport system ATPase subunit